LAKGAAYSLPRTIEFAVDHSIQGSLHWEHAVVPLQREQALCQPDVRAVEFTSQVLIEERYQLDVTVRWLRPSTFDSGRKPLNGLEGRGVTVLRGIAIALNNRGIRTARGGEWQVSNVRNVLSRAATPTCQVVL
jgi:hypothetical protein